MCVRERERVWLCACMWVSVNWDGGGVTVAAVDSVMNFSAHEKDLVLNYKGK